MKPGRGLEEDHSNYPQTELSICSDGCVVCVIIEFVLDSHNGVHVLCRFESEDLPHIRGPWALTTLANWFVGPGVKAKFKVPSLKYLSIPTPNLPPPHLPGEEEMSAGNQNPGN